MTERSVLARNVSPFVVRSFRVVHEAKASHYICKHPYHCQARLVFVIAWGAVCRLTGEDSPRVVIFTTTWGKGKGEGINNLPKAASLGFAGVSSSSPDEVADSAAGGNIAAEGKNDIA